MENGGVLGWEAPKENQAKARIALSSFINGKHIKITAVVFFIPSQKHSTFLSNTAHLQNTKVQKNCAVFVKTSPSWCPKTSALYCVGCQGLR